MNTAETATVLSVGYERRSIGELVAALQANGVRRLLDVRQVAFSRRAEYRKVSLAERLAEAGIEYVHLHAAGNPYRDDNDRERCLSSYRAHVNRNPGIVQALVAAIGRGRAAVLCYERAHAECHRSVLLAALTRAVGATHQPISVVAPSRPRRPSYTRSNP